MAEKFEQQQFSLPAGAVEVVLLRHGASTPIGEGESFALLDGHGDPPLSAEGEVQARGAAERLAGEPLAGLFTTGLLRTTQTAAPLAKLTRLQPVEVPELREVRLGDWEGGEFRIRVQRGDPLAAEVFAQQRWDVIPNAESMESLAQRAGGCRGDRRCRRPRSGGSCRRARRGHRRALPPGHRQPPVRVHPRRQLLDLTAGGAGGWGVAVAVVQRHGASGLKQPR